MTRYADSTGTFPFLLGRAFIEAQVGVVKEVERSHFPSFLEGLSLRRRSEALVRKILSDFLSYLEGLSLRGRDTLGLKEARLRFPLLFVGAFIEAAVRMR